MEILPDEAKENKINFTSSDTTVLLVDGEGNITGVSSGQANVVVSSENGAVSKSITITVYSPVEDVYIDSEDIMLKSGETYKLNAIISPDDASNKRVVWSSSHIDVATIEANGSITALTEGITTITVITQDGQKEKSINVLVMKNYEGTEIIFNTSWTTNGNMISGLNYLDTTAASIKNSITTAFNLEIYNYKGELLSDNGNVGTGSKIVFKNDDNQIVTEYNVILYGDANGDGKINSVDLLILQRHILKIQTFDGLFLKAGNILKNGKNPSSLDSLKIQRHILKLEIIGQ